MLTLPSTSPPARSLRPSSRSCRPTACCGIFNSRQKSSAMSLTAERLDEILTLPGRAAWNAVVDETLAICRKPLKTEKVEAEIARRDRALADLDQVLAT